MLIVASGAAALVAVVILGGPRTGYLPGIVISTCAALVLLGRLDPPQYVRWLAVALLVAYHIGGTVIIGSTVLAHQSFGGDVVRYDRGLHLVGGVLAVLLVGEIARRRRTMRLWVVLAIAVAFGSLVEATELAHAVALPEVFSYDVVDSSLDVAGNAAGYALGAAVLLRMNRRAAVAY